MFMLFTNNMRHIPSNQPFSPESFIVKLHLRIASPNITSAPMSDFLRNGMNE